MNDLILRALQGPIGPEEEEELRRWRSASPDHEARYRAMAEVWRRTALAERGVPRRTTPTFAELEARARRTGRARRPPNRVPPLATLRWAAVFVVALGLGFSVGGFWWAPSESPAPLVSELLTAGGEMATHILADGSVIRMAPNSRARIVLAADERAVHLEGLAFLVVAPDPARPFHVRTRGGAATVLGTRFEVDARASDEMALLVVEGRVSVRGTGPEAELGPGERARTRGEELPEVEEVPFPDLFLDWMGNFVAFESTPLPQVARELERLLGTPIRIVDPALAERTVTGAYIEEDLGFVLESVCRAAGVNCVVTADTVLMTP